MPPKKQKAQKMALSDFFADTTTGSWADEMDSLPTAPAARDTTGPKKGEPGYLDSMPDRGARSFPGAPPQREELPLPTVPPFTAFVGNLTFETDEEELRSFFSSFTPTSVRLVKEPQTGKPKGFGYVEFGSQADLKGALGQTGTMLSGRTVRISVAEAPSSSNRREYVPSAAEESSQWRRSGPLPTRETQSRDAPTPRRGPSFANSATDDRDWGSARGAKFVPVPPSVNTGFGIRRESSGPGSARDYSPSVADEAGQWRSSRPAATTTTSSIGTGGGKMASGQSSPSLADQESTWSRGTKLRTPLDTPPLTVASPTTEERDWRGSRAPSAVPSNEGESPKPTPPTERRKLTLAPRSAVPSSSETPTSTTSTSNSIFGNAKPVDSASREKAVEERIAQKEQERKKAAEDDKAKEAEKIKAEADARAKAISDAREKARAEIEGASSGGQGQGQRRGPGSGPHQGRGGGPRIHPSRMNSNSNTNGNSSSTTPTSPRRKSSQQQIGEDGFEGVTRGSKTSTTNTNVAPVKKDAPVRQGFSFAAAMRGAAAAELVEGGDDDDDEEEDNEEGKGSKKVNGNENGNGIEEVTKKVSEVRV